MASPAIVDEKWLFSQSLNNDSKAYRNVAMELIFLCRFFAQTHEQSPKSFIQLRNVLIAADDAFKSAAEARKWTSQDVDKKFVQAIRRLRDFEERFVFKDHGPVTSDSKAKMGDESKSPSMILSALIKNLHAKPMGNERLELTRVVRFHVLTSLPDARPIVVQQVLSDISSVQEVLWNFSNFKDEKNRLTLRDNPRFHEKLPTSPKAYGASLKIDPIENFLHANDFDVLIDKAEPVHIMTKRDTQVFGNFWCPQKAIIFKDICGRLRGERIIKASLRGTHCGLCEQLRPSLQVSTISRASGNHRQLQPIITEGRSWLGWKCSVGCLPMHRSVDLGLCICIGRAAPDRMFLVPPPPISQKPGYIVAYRTHIYMLNNDSLLQIFHYYRLEDEENWNLRLTWRKLAHVCRRWRHLISYSWSHLDICLLLSNNSPSLDTLDHLPPLPLAIDYSDKTRVMTLKDEDNIHFGLQQHGRVRQVVLRAPSSRLCMWLGLMNNFFPKLVELSLLSMTTEEMSLVLPVTFQAPYLHCLSLHGIGLPKGLSFLSSAIALSTLSLTHIQDSCYFPPGELVTQLQDLPHLEELSIGFAIPIPLPSSERELLPAPIPPVALPTLRRVTFRGVDAYLDNLVAQINTPHLERLSVTLFFDLTFSLVNLTELMHRTEGFECLVARVIFNKNGPSIHMGHSDQEDIGKLSLHVNCEPLDWQIDSVTQVCIALGEAVSALEELTLDLNVDGMPSNWKDTLDESLWHELLLPLTGVKKLRIDSSLTTEISQALESVAGGLILELLPGLQDLELRLGIKQLNQNKALSAFVKTRESVGRPVHLLIWPISSTLRRIVPRTTPRIVPRNLRSIVPRVRTESPVPRTVPPVPVSRANPEIPRTDSELHYMDAMSVLKYTDYVGRPYQNQAVNLISICRNFILTQSQTFDSYNELRSVSQVVDDALGSAAKVQKKNSKVADKKLKYAVDVLCAYERKYHLNKTVVEMMVSAEAEDDSVELSTILNRPKEKLSVREGLQMTFASSRTNTNSQPSAEERQAMTIEFLIHKSLLDHSPTIVKVMLGPHLGLSEVLWIFSNFNDENIRLALEQNPCFYRTLSTSPKVYGGEFRMDPIETFQHERVSVLVDNPDQAGQVFLETAEEVLAFVNVWVPNDAIIFKDVRGTLVGESVVEAAIQGIPNIWCFEELALSPASQLALSANQNRRNGPSLTVNATQITSAAGTLMRDWREPILRMLQSRDVYIRITDKPHSRSSLNNSTASS